MYAYINYPNPHITIHQDRSCPMIGMHDKAGQRVILVTSNTAPDVLRDFIDQKYRFAASRELNDMWLSIDLDTYDQEIGFVNIIQILLGRRYTPLATAKIDVHC